MSDPEKETVGIILPKWFLWIVSCVSTLFLVLFIPWGAWLTSSVMVILVKIDDTKVNERGIDRETQINRSQELEIERIRSKLEVIESQIRDLNN